MIVQQFTEFDSTRGTSGYRFDLIVDLEILWSDSRMHFNYRHTPSRTNGQDSAVEIFSSSIVRFNRVRNDRFEYKDVA